MPSKASQAHAYSKAHHPRDSDFNLHAVSFVRTIGVTSPLPFLLTLNSTRDTALLVVYVRGASGERTKKVGHGTGTYLFTEHVCFRSSRLLVRRSRRSPVCDMISPVLFAVCPCGLIRVGPFVPQGRYRLYKLEARNARPLHHRGGLGRANVATLLLSRWRDPLLFRAVQLHHPAEQEQFQGLET